MGSFFSSNNKQPVKVLLTGLDAAGKTTMLYKLKIGDISETIPMFGLHLEKTRYGNLEITSWDSGGRTRMDWAKKPHVKDVAGVIYFVDANDRDRVEESAEELKKELALVESDRKPDEAVPLLIYANKMDLPNAMTEYEIIDKFNLRSMHNRPWHLQSSCAPQGTGLFEGLDWFTAQLQKRCYGVTAACDLSNNKA